VRRFAHWRYLKGEGKNMKKMKKLNLLALACGMALSGAASAATINFGGLTGPLIIHYRNLDVGHVYTADAASEAAANAMDDTTLPGGVPHEDFWGIALVDTIQVGATFVYVNSVAALQGDKQISAIFYGGHDVQVDVDATTNSETIWSNNVSVDFFASVIGDNSDGMDFPTSPNANNRTNPSGPSFAGVTDGTHIFSFIGIAGQFPENPAAEFKTTVSETLSADPITGLVGGGTLFLKLAPTLLGTGNSNFLFKDNADPAPDARVSFQTILPAGADLGTATGFNTGSADPLLAQAVPTPSIAASGLVGLCSLLVGRGRRRK